VKQEKVELVGGTGFPGCARLTCLGTGWKACATDYIFSSYRRKPGESGWAMRLRNLAEEATVDFNGFACLG
jgi:hypothetical protein